MYTNSGKYNSMTTYPSGRKFPDSLVENHSDRTADEQGDPRTPPSRPFSYFKLALSPPLARTTFYGDKFNRRGWQPMPICLEVIEKAPRRSLPIAASRDTHLVTICMIVADRTPPCLCGLSRKSAERTIHQTTCQNSILNRLRWYARLWPLAIGDGPLLPAIRHGYGFEDSTRISPMRCLRPFPVFASVFLTIVATLYSAVPAMAQEQPAATDATEATETTPAEGQPAEINPKELVEKGEAALKEGKYQEAIDVYQQLARGVEQSTQLEYQARVLLLSMAYTGRGQALAGLREFTAAEEDFAKVLTDQPNFMPALIARGKMYLEMGSPDQALTDFEAAVKLERTNLDAQFGLGKAYIQLGGYQQGIGPLTHVLEAQPENAEAYRLRGTGYAGVNKFTPAIADLEKAVSIDPQDFESYFMMGIVYLRMEDYARSVEQLGKAIDNYKPKPDQEDQPFAQGHLTRAAVFIELGKASKEEDARKAAYQGAVDEAQRLLDQLDPKNPQFAAARAGALHARGVGERMLGQLGTAIQTFSEAIELNPELAEAYYRRGICFHMIGEDKMAISDFAESANINFEDPRANLWEGYTHAKLGDYHEAIRAYGDAISVSDRYAPAYVNRGLAYMALGENEKAVDDFDDAIRLEPANADVYFKRGVAYQRLGDEEKASASFASAIEFNNEYEPAHRHMAEVLQRLGKTKEADEYRQKAEKLLPPRQ
jgi:tetratricopeptide (TPR) repeat protein